MPHALASASVSGTGDQYISLAANLNTQTSPSLNFPDQGVSLNPTTPPPPQKLKSHARKRAASHTLQNLSAPHSHCSRATASGGPLTRTPHSPLTWTARIRGPASPGPPPPGLSSLVQLLPKSLASASVPGTNGAEDKILASRRDLGAQTPRCGCERRPSRSPLSRRRWPGGRIYMDSEAPRTSIPRPATTLSAGPGSTNPTGVLVEAIEDSAELLPAARGARALCAARSLGFWSLSSVDCERRLSRKPAVLKENACNPRETRWGDVGAAEA